MKFVRLRKFISNCIRMVYPFFRYQRSKIRIRSLIKEKRKIWLDVGGGDKKGENGWITIDITDNCDIFWDLRFGLPFPDESVSKIYSSHFFEHLSYKEGQKFLKECLRGTVPSGTFSICVPNARIYIEAYAKCYSLNQGPFFGVTYAYNNTTKIDYVNYMAYMDGNHKYMFDEENLLFILKAIGFRNVQLREFEPDLDLKEREFESIYAQAEK